jgi:hypothetical protein
MTSSWPSEGPGTPSDDGGRLATRAVGSARDAFAQGQLRDESDRNPLPAIGAIARPLDETPTPTGSFSSLTDTATVFPHPRQSFDSDLTVHSDSFRSRIGQTCVENNRQRTASHAEGTCDPDAVVGEHLNLTDRVPDGRMVAMPKKLGDRRCRSRRPFSVSSDAAFTSMLPETVPDWSTTRRPENVWKRPRRMPGSSCPISWCVRPSLLAKAARSMRIYTSRGAMQHGALTSRADS